MKYQDFFQWAKSVNMLNVYCDRAYERAKNIVNYKEKLKIGLQKIKNWPRKN